MQEESPHQALLRQKANTKYFLRACRNGVSLTELDFQIGDRWFGFLFCGRDPTGRLNGGEAFVRGPFCFK